MNALRASVALCALATFDVVAAAAPQSCGADLVFPRLIEGDHYVVAYRTLPSPIVAGEPFAVEFAACPRAGAAAPQSVRVDATMPEHRHGMNYRPTVVAKGDGRYRADGMLFHMSGRWEITFDLVMPSGVERLAGSLHLE
jgi:hypothetical protein